MTELATSFVSQQTVQFSLLGMATGSLYALVALGIVLAYRSSGVLNFSAGSVGGVAAFFFYSMRDDHGWATAPALVTALVLAAALGAVTQIVILTFLRQASLVAKLIATLGVMATAQGAVALIFGNESKGLPSSVLPDDTVRITDQILIPQGRLIIIGVAIVLAVVLKVLYSTTLFGLATSAAAENRRVTSAYGWSPSKIELLNFTLAGLLSGIAAIMLAPIIGLAESTLALAVLPALAAALAGRLSSFALTVISALAIGVATSVIGLFLPDIARTLGVSIPSVTGLPNTIPLLVVILITVFAGRARLQRGEASTRMPLPGAGKLRPGWIIGSGVLVVIIAFTVSDSWVDAIVTSIAGGLLVLSVVVLTGYAGQLSLAQFALAGFGCWVASRLVATRDLPFGAAVILGVITTVAAGLVVALSALRARGVSLAVATLGLALMINALIFTNGALTGGFVGTLVKTPSVFGYSLDPIGHAARYATFGLVVFILVGLMVANLRRGRTGRRLLAVRGNERAAASLGIGVYSAKLYAFGVASAIAALSGIVLGFRQPHIQFSQFDISGSINALLNAVLGGVGYASGSVIGGAQTQGGITTQILNELFPGSSNVVFWLEIVSGAGVILLLRQSPDGLAALYTKLVGDRLPTFKRRRPGASAQPVPRRPQVPKALEVRNVTMHFGGVVALDDVSFNVHPGEVVGLIGPNGAGKTTMLDVMTGFTGQTAGSVLFGGQVIDGWSPEKRARSGMARSWQSVELFEEMTVRENLLVAADRQRAGHYLLDLVWPGRQRPSEILQDVVAEFGLGPFLDLRPSMLSQGTARLCGIARAMVAQPSVLLLDEPAAGLDTHESAELGKVIRRIAKEWDVAVVIVEHDVELIMGLCDRITVLDFGKQLADDVPAAVRENPEVVHAYLGDAPTVGRPERAGVAGPDRSTAVLEVENLCAGYARTTIVRDLDLRVGRGEVVALLGTNGAGKTTTVRTLAGELPKHGGVVRIAGCEVVSAVHHRVRDGLGLVSEERTVLMRMTVAENLRLSRGDRQLALDLFPELEPHLNRRVGMLSGGQQQMLSLARALSRKPRLVIADELSFGLSPQAAARLLQAIRAAADTGIGVLLVEQQVQRALEVADHAYILRHGRVEISGAAPDLREAMSDIQSLYLTGEGVNRV
ncbi:ATP-binding cassette domain-containing protein [Amycolatopsis pithecellobii]|uniref:ATP-binding cassette domain-containing protein n=1 Tax=Amycolatopsis pithecellobii TaxID=664692 RepID=A0A6N7Z5B6_9PSEU|nr:ATP-binding cassette domain-containing protein [Amycolatopsis pithecellobii]MTD55680.1 ATP-binding cassette domain-containing protein [Amycolatopsis pithecellobii]